MRAVNQWDEVSLKTANSHQWDSYMWNGIWGLHTSDSHPFSFNASSNADILHSPWFPRRKRLPAGFYWRFVPVKANTPHPVGYHFIFILCYLHGHLWSLFLALHWEDLSRHFRQQSTCLFCWQWIITLPSAPSITAVRDKSANARRFPWHSATVVIWRAVD